MAHDMELVEQNRGFRRMRLRRQTGVLKQAGLVRDRHEGRHTHYTAQLGALAPLIDWTSQMAGFWQSRFDHLMPKIAETLGDVKVRATPSALFGQRRPTR
jgi:hypothetical protein